MVVELEVEVRGHPFRVPRVPDPADELSLFHVAADAQPFYGPVRESVVEHSADEAVLMTRVGPTYRFSLDIPIEARGQEFEAQSEYLEWWEKKNR